MGGAETRVKDSTGLIINGLNSELVTETYRTVQDNENASIDGFKTRLKKLHLGENPQMIELISANRDCGNRLITLFKLLKECMIPLTEQAACVIAANISCVGGAINLLGLLKQVDIAPNSVPLDVLFHAAKSDSSVAQNARELYDRGVHNRSCFDLIFAYPEQSFTFSQLILNLRERAYSTESLVDKLCARSKRLK